MIAARLPPVAVHALLHDDPGAVVGDDEAVQIEIEAVLHRRTVDLGDEPARPDQPVAVEADALPEARELVRGAPRMLAAAAADMDAELAGERAKAPLQRADHARGDAGGMPVHAHHGAEGLEPERMRQPAQEFLAAVVMHDRLADHGSERGHPAREPGRHAAAMERQVCASGPRCHGTSGLLVDSGHYSPVRPLRPPQAL